MYYLIHNLKLSPRIPLIAVVINAVMYVAMVVLFCLEFFFYPNDLEDRPRVVNHADAAIERTCEQTPSVFGGF
jgi:hypothetical protein